MAGLRPNRGVPPRDKKDDACISRNRSPIAEFAPDVCNQLPEHRRRAGRGGGAPDKEIMEAIVFLALARARSYRSVVASSASTQRDRTALGTRLRRRRGFRGGRHHHTEGRDRAPIRGGCRFPPIARAAAPAARSARRGACPCGAGKTKRPPGSPATRFAQLVRSPARIRLAKASNASGMSLVTPRGARRRHRARRLVTRSGGRSGSTNVSGLRSI